MNELISVIVPVYNVEKYLPKCIESILVQTYKNIEVILVNDGSPDRCGKICDEYAKKDSRIKVIHKENGGLSDARNCGIDMAIGEYIGFVDSDDYVKEDMYKTLLSQIKEHNADIAVCGRYRVHGEDYKEIFTCKGSVIMDSKEALKRILIYDCMDSSFCDKLFSAQLLKKIRFPLGRVGEDTAIIANVICNAEKIIHIGEAKYFYIKRDDSITTSNFSLKRLDLLISAENIRTFAINKYPDLNKEADFFYFKILIYLLKEISETKGMYIREKKQLQKILRLNLLKIIFNRYLTIGYKLKGTLLFLNLYMPVLKLYRILKQILVKG